MKYSSLVAFMLLSTLASTQTNFTFTNSTIPEILRGNYDASTYAQANVIADPAIIFEGLSEQVSGENLKSYIQILEGFGTRHTSSDTLSTVRGMGATRNWVLSMFEEFSQQNENRLIPFFFQFDQIVCTDMDRHKNACAILPGTNPNASGIVIVEAHMDSRCEGRCDVECPSPGADDNASGTALVIELARIMSQYSYDHTILFMATTGEEQGLIGANAFATYCSMENIAIKSVFNNDIVGGITCGKTSSPPSCPFAGAVDSTQVRMFSSGNSSKQFVRWIKLQYAEEMLPMATVPMMLTIMAPLDRTGRGGDHIPFHDRGHLAMRFTSANENGDANVTDPAYCDHQHTSSDLLGVDTDGDGIQDSLFVDFNYLTRNTQINGTSITSAATGPDTPLFNFDIDGDSIRWSVQDPQNLNHYRIARRVSGNDFDTIMTFQGATSGAFRRLATQFFQDEIISGAGVDADGIESFFGDERFFLTILTSTDEVEAEPKGYELFQNVRNPFSKSTVIQYNLGDLTGIREVAITITNTNGQIVDRVPATRQLGINSFNYYPTASMVGNYFYSLEINGEYLSTKQMVIVR